MFLRRNFVATTLGLILCLASIVGCGSRISKSNYDRIQNGMSVSEVEAILGPGTEQQSADASFGGFSLNYKNIIWQSKDDDQIITITFSNDKVQAKAQFGL